MPSVGRAPLLVYLATLAPTATLVRHTLYASYQKTNYYIVDYSQCLPGTGSPGSTTTSSLPPSTTSSGPTPTGSQIRTVQDPVYHFYLQNNGKYQSQFSFPSQLSDPMKQVVSPNLVLKPLLVILPSPAPFP